MRISLDAGDYDRRKGADLDDNANPYSGLPAQAFWRPAVADRSMFDIDQLWTPKFNITQRTKIATYGSCFAQNIGKALASRGYQWLVSERAPFGMSADNARKFNYGIFSARTANIYTTSLLRQWASWATGEAAPPEEYWEQDGRFYDPMRPTIEPGGFRSIEEMERSRTEAIGAFRTSIAGANMMLFTLGLTERWTNRHHGYEYPMCPGTAAGTFDPDAHVFNNQDYTDIRSGLLGAIKLMRTINPGLRMMLTVSPVPLTATMSGQHILVASMHTKSILRAVAGQLAADNAAIDYFPSYELVNSPVFRGAFFAPNQRNVSRQGVDFVMEHFLGGIERKSAQSRAMARQQRQAVLEAAVCEEELLAAFGRDA